MVAGSIGSGLFFAVLLFMLVSLYNRRHRHCELESKSGNTTPRDTDVECHNSKTRVRDRPQTWAQSMFARDDGAASTLWSATADPYPASPARCFIPRPPSGPVPFKAAATLGLAERPFPPTASFYHSPSVSPVIQTDDMSIRAAHTKNPRGKSPMDHAIDDLELELARYSGLGQTREIVPHSTHNGYASGAPAQDIGMIGSLHRLNVPSRNVAVTPWNSPVSPPPRGPKCKVLTTGKRYNPHHSRLPEGAFF
jgi:hypothetical protein